MQKKAIDIALNALADKVHGVASAIVDPATGKRRYIRATAWHDHHDLNPGSPDFAGNLNGDWVSKPAPSNQSRPSSPTSTWRMHPKTTTRWPNRSRRN
ncbi:MAG: hypothetical protein IPL62_20855 [Caulobacteraceae bacterium]|nr:hypothetical protein [Caulobacteraceae bacterium]